MVLTNNVSTTLKTSARIHWKLNGLFVYLYTDFSSNCKTIFNVNSVLVKGDAYHLF